MRARVPALRQLLGTDEEVFKRVYMHTFALARTQGQKSLLLETAIEYWKLLLNKRFEAQLPVWIEFLQKEYRKSVSKDTWNCMYDFIQLAQKDPGLKTYDVDGLLFCLYPGSGGSNADGAVAGAWPSILDDFVRYWRKRHPQAEPTDGDAME